MCYDFICCQVAFALGLDDEIIASLSRYFSVDSDVPFGQRRILSRERQMFVDSVSIDQEVGDSTILSVNYKGLIVAKKDDVIPSVEMRSLSEVPTGGYVTPVTFMSPVPTVTHLYVSDTRPDVFAVGTAKVPPTFPNSSTLSNYFTAYRADQTAIFVGWILKGRLPEECGGLFQCVDTYTYETITAPTQ